MKLNIGENIRRLRRAADMTQEQLADKLGVAFQSISRWENGTTYPDIEFLPALAGIFGVTVDELIGCEESKKKKLLEDRVEELEALVESESPDVEAILNRVREIRRDCTATPSLRSSILGGMLFHFANCGWCDEFQNSPELMAELRLVFEEVMATDSSREHKEEMVCYMACIEDEANMDAFLDQNATRHDLSRDTLLYERYKKRKCFDKEEMMRQKTLFVAIANRVFSSDLLRIGEGVLNLRENLQINTTLLTYLHNICGVEPDAAHPITGDGSVDIFAPDRIDFGIRRACYLAASGDTEGAFVVLEDTVTLLESLMSLEEGSEIGCASRWMRDLRLRVEYTTLNGVGRTLRSDSDPYHYFYGGVDSEWVLYPFIATKGWEWFDPIRTDPRFASYVERVKAAFALDSKTE